MSNGDSQLGGLATVTAGVSVLSGALGAAVLTGVLERAPRNHPELMGAAFVAAAAAGLLWTVAAIAPGTPQGTLKVLAALALTGSVALALIVVVMSYSENEKPSISADVNGDGTLTGSVKISGLKSDEAVGIRVEGLQESKKSPSGWAARILYEAALGPNASGTVDHPIRLAIAPGFYELIRVRATSADDYAVCPPDRIDPNEPLKRRIGTGCLVLTLAPLPAAPRVSAAWVNSTDDSKLGVKATVQADNTPHRVAVDVIANADGASLARALLLPDSKGKLDSTVEVPVTATTRSVCIVARWVGGDLRAGPRIGGKAQCPPPYSPDSSWVILSRAASK
jgi:hypothetical protein